MFPTKPSQTPALPRVDANKTWRGATKAALDFGHRPAADGHGGQALVAYDAPSGALLWGDSRTRVSADQWANMGSSQREACLRQVPAARRRAVAEALAGGTSAQAQTTAPTRSRLTLSPGRDGGFQQRLRRAAQQATTEHKGQLGACYDTANRTGALLGGHDLDGAKDVTTARGRDLAHLRESAAAGTLKPGMAVYVNLAPGTNPRSLNDGSRPHWVTYLGQDPDGTMRFADQFRADWSLAELAAAYGPRRIDCFVDPYARTGVRA